MISDVLSDAIGEIDRYLREMPAVYSGALRRRVIVLRQAMRDLQRELDNPFSPDDPDWRDPGPSIEDIS